MSLHINNSDKDKKLENAQTLTVNTFGIWEREKEKESMWEWDKQRRMIHKVDGKYAKMERERERRRK